MSPHPKVDFALLNIFGKEVNSFYIKDLKIYEVHIFSEFKKNLYLPFKYNDGLEIKATYL